MQLEHSFSVPVDVDTAWQVLLDIERIAPCMPGAALDSVTGDEFTGSVKVKLGPIGLTYKGKASFVEKDQQRRRAVISAQARDARGNGSAAATITASLQEAGGATEVHVVTDLDISGKPAQFGRGVMVDVGNKLLGQFADCLAETLRDDPVPSSSDGPIDPAPSGQWPVGAAPGSPGVQSGQAGDAHAPPSADPPDTTLPIAAAGPGPAATGSAESHQATLSSSTNRTSTTAQRSAPRRGAEPIDLLDSAGGAVAKRLLPLVAGLVLVVVLLRRRGRR